jgi:hypothetical protein
MARITQDIVEAQSFGYSVCATESTDLAIDSEIHGQPHCACEHDCRGTFYWWGVDLLSRTPSEGCDCDDKCVDTDLACEAIGLLNPGCIVCGCGSPDDVPVSCDIVQDRTVYQALDADQQTVVPNVAGRTTLIISDLADAGNEWADNVGNIATDDGAGTFTYYIPPDATIVLSSANSTYYVTYPGGAGPLYPPIDGTQNFTTLILISRFPAITLMYGRTVVVEISEDGVAWTPIYSGPETPLAYGVTLTLADGYLPVQSRTTYYYGEEDTCTFQYADGTIPPFVPPPCGVLVYTVTPESACGTDNWSVNIDFTQIDGWGIGTVTPVVNGVAVPADAQNIILGTLTFGPYIMGDLVTFDFTSNLDAACDFSTQTYFDPRVVEQDFNVLRAVDADEYAALSGDGEDYYIVSDLNGSADPWAAEVGSIWLGGSSTYQAVANLETVYATNPGGALGFWQGDGTFPAAIPKQYFPQPLFVYNTVTLITAVTLPPVAPYTQAWSTLFMQALWTPVAGSPVTIYNGAPGGFLPSGFTIPVTTTWPAVTGIAAYSDGCPVRVPALLDTFTPTGVPVEDFQFLGVNNDVTDILEQPNGAWMMTGYFTEFDPTGAPVRANGIIRLNTDGTLDTTYNNVANNPTLPITGPGRRGFANTNDLIGNPDCNAVTWSMAKDSQSRVTICGNFTEYNGVAAGGILRLLPDGSRDTSFVGAGLLLTSPAGFTNGNCLTIDELDRVVCVGWFNRYNGTPVGNVVMINPTDGSINTTFNTNANGGFNFRTQKVIYDRGSQTFLVTSAQPSASAYGATPILTPPALPGVGTRKTVVRIDGGVSPGTLNSILATGTKFLEFGAPLRPDIFMQADRSLLFTGSFTDYDGTPANRIARLLPAGNIDSAFVAGVGAAFSGQTLAVAQMPNGQIMVGSGSTVFTDSLLVPKNVLGLIRLNADGTTDFLWNTGTGFDGTVTCLQVNSLGDLLVGGTFTTLNGAPCLRIVKL